MICITDKKGLMNDGEASTSLSPSFPSPPIQHIVGAREHLVQLKVPSFGFCDITRSLYFVDHPTNWDSPSFAWQSPFTRANPCGRQLRKIYFAAYDQTSDITCFSRVQFHNPNVLLTRLETRPNHTPVSPKMRQNSSL